jgi:hypothetical protein
MQDKGETQVRAWVEYFRDLGVHDFYRRGEPVPQPVRDADEGPATVNAAVESGGYFSGDTTSTPPIAETNFMPPPVRLISFNDLAPMPSAAA